MFSTTPVGVTPASKRIARSRPPVVTRTSAEKPGSAISASGRPSSVRAEAARGFASWWSQVVRSTCSVGKSRGSVTLSIRIVIRTASTGASGIVTMAALRISRPARPRLPTTAWDREAASSGSRSSRPRSAGEQRDEQRDLQRDRARLGVDVGGSPPARPAAGRRAAPRARCCVITSALCSSASATCCCCAGVRTSLESACAVKMSDSDGEHDRAGEREAERQAERAAGRVDAGRLADALLLDRRQRVVVQLRDEQAEPGAGDRAAGSPSPSRSPRAARSGSARATPAASSTNPTRMILLGLRPARFLPREQRDARTCVSDSGASDRPASIALYSSTICR